MNKETQADLRDWILFGLETATAVLSLYLAVKVLIGQSGLKTIRMQFAKAGEDTCQAIAVVAANGADKCRKIYESSRDVTV